MDRWIGHVAFVTGASSGIGKVISIKLVEHGLKVVGFARRKELLEQIAKEQSSAKGKFYPCPGDASKKEDILKALQWTKDNVGPVSILINNAAIVSNVSLRECDHTVLEKIYDINVLAPCITTREVIKHMKENKVDGHIINFNSIAGQKIILFPNDGLYTGTKHALRAITETLRLELASENSKIKVTSIHPGAVRTEMLNQILSDIENPQEAIPTLEADDVANAVIYALSTPPTVNITQITIQAVRETY